MESIAHGMTLRKMSPLKTKMGPGASNDTPQSLKKKKETSTKCLHLLIQVMQEGRSLGDGKLQPFYTEKEIPLKAFLSDVQVSVFVMGYAMGMFPWKHGKGASTAQGCSPGSIRVVSV